MDTFEEIKPFRSFGKQSHEVLAAQLKFTTAELSGMGKSYLDFVLPQQWGPIHSEADIVLLFEGLQLILRYAAVGTDVEVHIFSKKGERLWKIFIDLGHVVGGPYKERIVPDVKAPGKGESASSGSLAKKSLRFSDQMKLVLFEAMKKVGEPVNATGINNFLSGHSAEDVDGLVGDKDIKVFRAWVERRWSTTKGVFYGPRVPLIDGNLPGFSVSRLLAFYKENYEK